MVDHVLRNYDDNKNRHLDKNETENWLTDLFKAWGYKISDNLVNNLMEVFDVNKDGEFSRKELKMLITYMLESGGKSKETE